MSNYLLPTDEEFVEVIARAIARNRLHGEASDAVKELVGFELSESERLENSFDVIFEKLWAGELPEDMRQKSAYRSDALAAIRAINLKLLTTVQE
jgi:hypothetical protein